MPSFKAILLDYYDSVDIVDEKWASYGQEFLTLFIRAKCYSSAAGCVFLVLSFFLTFAQPSAVTDRSHNPPLLSRTWNLPSDTHIVTGTNPKPLQPMHRAARSLNLQRCPRSSDDTAMFARTYFNGLGLFDYSKSFEYIY